MKACVKLLIVQMLCPRDLTILELGPPRVCIIVDMKQNYLRVNRSWM